MRKKIIAANWKMNKDVNETSEFIASFQKEMQNYDCPAEVIICPPFISLQAAARLLQGSRIELGAQNLHYESDGAYTGEISARMLKSLGVHYVIVGHSERRQFFGETDEIVTKKVKKALASDLKVILCVGESLAERDGAVTEKVLERQVKAALEGLTEQQLATLVIAYEPIWAIGTGRNATPQQAEEAHAFIRSVVAKLFSREAASALTIQYGGSVKPDNASQLLSQPDVDGALVGGASLVADSFAKIVKSCPFGKTA
ncbi:MAG: triose-phosphate isomerase [Bacteroidetes bacterium]|nr:triose-phosphate isomerase [Bacteroidota bacterium]